MNPMIAEALIKYVMVPASVLFAALLAKLLHKAAEYFHAKAAAETANALSSHFYEATSVLTRAVESAVMVLEDTVRPTLKAASEDGKISKEEGAALKAQAIEVAKAQAMAAAPQIIEAAGLGDLDVFLSHLVDVAAAKLAGNSRVALNPTPAPASMPAPGTAADPSTPPA